MEGCYGSGLKSINRDHVGVAFSSVMTLVRYKKGFIDSDLIHSSELMNMIDHALRDRLLSTQLQVTL